MTSPQSLARESFGKLFETIFGKEIPRSVLSQIESAEKVRDKIMHGKAVPDPQKPAAVCEVLDCARALTDFANAKVASVRSAT